MINFSLFYPVAGTTFEGFVNGNRVVEFVSDPLRHTCIYSRVFNNLGLTPGPPEASADRGLCSLVRVRAPG